MCQSLLHKLPELAPRLCATNPEPVDVDICGGYLRFLPRLALFSKNI